MEGKHLILFDLFEVHIYIIIAATLAFTKFIFLQV